MPHSGARAAPPRPARPGTAPRPRPPRRARPRPAAPGPTTVAPSSTRRRPGAPPGPGGAPSGGRGARAPGRRRRRPAPGRAGPRSRMTRSLRRSRSALAGQVEGAAARAAGRGWARPRERRRGRSCGSDVNGARPAIIAHERRHQRAADAVGERPGDRRRSSAGCGAPGPSASSWTYSSVPAAFCSSATRCRTHCGRVVEALEQRRQVEAVRREAARVDDAAASPTARRSTRWPPSSRGEDDRLHARGTPRGSPPRRPASARRSAGP